MTTTVVVHAHCPSDTEVAFGITKVGEDGIVNKELNEVVILQDGEKAEKVVYEGRIAVILERKKKI